MNQDQHTLRLAQACYEIASAVQPGGRAQAVSKIQVLLNNDAASNTPLEKHSGLSHRELVQRTLASAKALGEKGFEDALVQLLDAASLSSHPSNATGTAAAIAGYTKQTDAKVAIVNQFKQDEERLLRKIDHLLDTIQEEVPCPIVTDGTALRNRYDPRWLAEARTDFQKGFMALNRAVFQPQRIKLPEDD